MEQTDNSATFQNICKELVLGQPTWKQFHFYLNDVSPIGIHHKAAIESKKLKGFFTGNKLHVGIKIPYLRRSYQTKKQVGTVLAAALLVTLILAFAAMLFATNVGKALEVLAAVKHNTWMDTSAVFASVLGILMPAFFVLVNILQIYCTV